MPRTYALDATPMLGKRTGIGRYVEELVAAMAPLLAEDEELVLFAGTGRLNPLFGVSHDALLRAAESPRVRYRRLWLPFRLLEPLWRRLGEPAADRVTGAAALFHGTNYRLPPLRRSAGIVTIHDLSVMRFPELVSRSFRAWFEHAVRDAVSRAARVVVDSDATRDDAMELLDVAAERLAVIPLGVSQAYFAASDPARDALRLEALGVMTPYVLAVGSLHPRKNLERLLAAFSRARAEHGLAHRLVLAGEDGFGGERVRERAAALGLGDAVVFCGYVPEEDLPALYRGASLLAFPSLCEGFGLPVLEAMASGCPVLTSTVSSLPQVAGGAAELVDPTSEDAIQDGLGRVLTDEDRRRGLIDRGRERAREFPWQRVAEAHLALYRATAASASP